MPMYEFACPTCQRLQEELMSRAERERARVECPKCETPMEPVLSSSSFAFLTAAGNWVGFNSNKPPKGSKKVAEFHPGSYRHG